MTSRAVSRVDPRRGQRGKPCSKHPHSWKRCMVKRAYGGKSYGMHGAYCGKCFHNCPHCFPVPKAEPAPARSPDRAVNRKRTGKFQLLSATERVQLNQLRLESLRGKRPFITMDDLEWAVFQCKSFEEFLRYVPNGDWTPLEHFIGRAKTPRTVAAVRTILVTLDEAGRAAGQSLIDLVEYR